MDRKEFISICSSACLGFIGVNVLLKNASLSDSVFRKEIQSNLLEIPLTDFQKIKRDKIKWRRYIIVEADGLQYPIVVYRNSETNYNALLLKCTHQGTVLDVSGDLISCSGHGSEFSTTGEVLNGPAAKELQNFPIQINNQSITLNLDVQ